MARKDVEQFNLRLNLNNPNHLKIYRTFQDLNTDIHKSRNNFIIEALLRYICLLYTSPSPRDLSTSRMPSSA